VRCYGCLGRERKLNVVVGLCVLSWFLRGLRHPRHATWSPHSSSKPAQEDAWVPEGLLPPIIMNAIRLVHPSVLSADGEWVDLTMLPGSFGTQCDIGVKSLLPPL
jgi:hypothetical protein